MAFLNFNMENQYTIEVLIILIEFSLIGFLIFMTIFLKIFYRSRKKTDDALSKLIESMLLRLIYQNKTFNKSKFPISWRRLHLLVPLIHKVDKEHSSGHWVSIRNKIVNEIVLPRARVIASSLDIRRRIWAAEAFCLMQDKDPANEEPILQLVNSPIPLISLNGIYAAVVYGSEKMIDAIIHRFSEQSWLFESSNLKMFMGYLENKGNFVENKLKSSSDKDIRAVCYNILTKCKPRKITWDIKQDIFSDNRELKISAIKFISHCDRAAAIPLLLMSLSDKLLEVKLVSIHRLRLLKVTESIPYLEEKLKDDELWVRLSAVQALLDFGLDQKEITKNLSVDVDQSQIFIKIPYTENAWW